jgi:hypothetical protein
MKRQIGRATKIGYLRVIDGGRSREHSEAEAGIRIRPGVFSAKEERLIRQQEVSIGA